MRRRLALVLVPLVVAAGSAGAQSTREGVRNRNPRPTSWVVSGGYAEQWGGLDDDAVVHTARGPLVGGHDAGPHVAVGAAWHVPTTALELRAEAFYNQLRGPANAVMGTTNGVSARMATRDRTFAAGVVLLWRARPERTFGPYLMTGAGYYYSRLTSAPNWEDPEALRVSGMNPGVSFGAGLELPLFGRAYFLEARRHVMGGDNVHGASFLPLTFGTRF